MKLSDLPQSEQDLLKAMYILDEGRDFVEAAKVDEFVRTHTSEQIDDLYKKAKNRLVN